MTWQVIAVCASPQVEPKVIDKTAAAVRSKDITATSPEFLETQQF
jgi:hypothetical protein